MSAQSPTEFERYHRFQEGLLAQGHRDLSPEEVLRLWRTENREYTDTVDAIREGLEDVEAGRVQPFEQFDREFRRQHDISNDA
jgi:hypothetical protein